VVNVVASFKAGCFTSTHFFKAARAMARLRDARRSSWPPCLSSATVMSTKAAAATTFLARQPLFLFADAVPLQHTAPQQPARRRGDGRTRRDGRDGGTGPVAGQGQGGGPGRWSGGELFLKVCSSIAS